MRKVCILLFLLPTVAFTQIGAKVQQQSKIFGLWHNNQFGYQMTLILNTDGSGEFDGESIRFTTQNNKLSITQSGQTTLYTFSQQGNTLTLTGGDIEGSIAFSRSGVEQAPAAVNTKANTPAAQKSNTHELIGVWSGNGETIEFKTTGECVYLGNVFQYESSQGQLTLKTGQGNALFAYTISGNQLSLTANGTNVSYTRGAGSTGSNNSNTIAGNGNISQELVGKWCWTNVNSTNSGGSSSSECIVLNANGTYQYASERSMDANTTSFYAGTSSQSSDQGTWWVQGDKIFYNSQTRGQGSYQLQKMNHPKTGDPMIILNGEAYVTFYQKQPWR